MESVLIPVILAGGVGSRLWPLSREFYPKQLLTLLGEKTLLQSAIERAAQIPGVSRLLIVGNEEQRFLIKDQIQALKLSVPFDIILEPTGKNTAPAAAIAAFFFEKHLPQANLLLLPADHHLAQQELFAAKVTMGMQFSSQGKLVTFGIHPRSAETGYGYIQKGEDLATGVAKISAFIEKPNRERAEQYLQAGGYYWNSGMFLFQVSRYLEELQQSRNDIYQAVKNCAQTFYHENGFTRIERQLFESCPSESIDYAVMEKTKCGAVIALDTEWSDVGSWEALYELENKDTDQNVCLGDVLSLENKNCYLRSQSRLLVGLGLQEHIVVETHDAVLVAPKNRSQDVKTIVNQLKAKRRGEVFDHRKIYRPWGSYEIISEGPGFKVKRITIKSAGKLTLHTHSHRVEHWIVVSGVAHIARKSEEFEVHEGESIFLPIGIKHRLENQTEEYLELIQVQTGIYLEDDLIPCEEYDETSISNS